jgi:nitroreductase
VKDAISAIMDRRSIRRYKPLPIPEEDLRKILEAGRRAPSAGNRQPWHFVVVTSPDVKEAVSEACSGQRWMADAGAIICGIGDPQAPWHPVDVAIAMQNMVIAATALGYGTCWIGAFNEGKVKEVLGIPEDKKVIALTPVGVPDESPGPRPRKPWEEVFSRDRFGHPM